MGKSLCLETYRLLERWGRLLWARLDRSCMHLGRRWEGEELSWIMGGSDRSWQHTVGHSGGVPKVSEGAEGAGPFRGCAEVVEAGAYSMKSRETVEQYLFWTKRDTEENIAKM